LETNYKSVKRRAFLLPSTAEGEGNDF